MSLFSSIGRSLGSFIKPLANIALQAVAPAAANMLKGVAGDFFSGGASALKTAASALPSPISSIANKLIDFGAGGLQNFANNGIDALLAKITGGARTATVDGNPVGIPTFTERTTASTTSASTAGLTPGGGSVLGGGNLGLVGGSSSIAALPNLNTTPASTIKAELKAKFPTLEDKDLDLMAAQETMSRYNQMCALITNLLKMQDDVKKGTIANIR